MIIITHHIKKDTLKIWDTKNINKFKRFLNSNRPETQGVIDFYRVLDYTRDLRGNTFELVRNEIILYEEREKEKIIEGDKKLWYEHSPIERSYLYNKKELEDIKFILDNYGDWKWLDIERGICPKPDKYPIIQAKSKNNVVYFPEKEEVQRIRVVEI
tara:strand:+ start:103 stop:573 length:471 start_codon:yes stop_codon:yes gene_type:complete